MAQKISSVIATTRKVTNEETGIDLHVYEERKNFASKRAIRATIYNIIVVSNLPELNTKEGETVQYTLDKSHEECEKLHKNLCKKFSGTLIPEIPSKPIRMMDTAEKAKARKNQVGNFLMFCAKTPKICNSEILQNFLGIKKLHIDDESEDSEPEQIPKPNKETIKQNTSLFTPVIESSREIFSQEKEEQEENDDDNLPEVEITNADEKKEKDNKVPATHDVKLFEDTDSELPMFQNVPVAQEIQEVESEKEMEQADASLFDDTESDEDLEELLNKLENAKNVRQAREKDITKRSEEAQKVKIEATSEVGEFEVSDISKYISENTVDLDDLDLGL